MDSTAWIALAGIAGTLLGSVGTMLVTARTARDARSHEDRAEARQARRQAYAVLATALVVCADTADTRMEALIEMVQQSPLVSDRHAVEKAGRLAEPLDRQLQAVTDALGPVLIEGPDAVAELATAAVASLRAKADRLELWDTQDYYFVEETILSQAEDGRREPQETTRAVHAFVDGCRKAIHHGGKAVARRSERQPNSSG